MSSPTADDPTTWSPAEVGPPVITLVKHTVVGRFMKRFRVVDGGVSMRGRPYWRSAEAVLAPNGITLRRRSATTTLAWSGDWAFSLYGGLGTRGDQFGIGVRSADAADALWRSWSWPLQIVPPRRRRSVVPIQAMASMANGAKEAVRLLDALRRLLAADPMAAARLRDPARAAELVAALHRWDGSTVRPTAGGRGRRPEEINATMRRAGFVHLTGRPYPGWTCDVDDVVERVREHLAVNAYVQELHITREEIASVVHAWYADVPAWPFDALVGGGSVDQAERSSSTT